MSPDPADHPVRRARLAKIGADGKPWRLEDLAEAIERSASMLSNVERGFVPKPVARERIAKALDTTVETLWPEEYPPA